eukprot:894359-Prorocentrum_minimum.AAC.4
MAGDPPSPDACALRNAIRGFTSSPLPKLDVGTPASTGDSSRLHAAAAEPPAPTSTSTRLNLRHISQFLGLTKGDSARAQCSAPARP